MTAAAPIVALKPEALDQMQNLAGTASKTELAAAIGAEPVELALAATGRTSPSLALIARIVVAFPQMSLASICTLGVPAASFLEGV